MNMIFQSLYYQYILDIFYFFISPKTFGVIITIIMCCPCYLPKYVPRLEGIMHSPYTTMWHYHMTLLCDTIMWHYYVTLPFDTTIWHYYMTLLYDTTMWHYYVTLLYDTTIWHYYVTLLCDTTMWNYHLTLLLFM